MIFTEIEDARGRTTIVNMDQVKYIIDNHGASFNFFDGTYVQTNIPIDEVIAEIVNKVVFRTGADK